MNPQLCLKQNGTLGSTTTVVDQASNTRECKIGSVNRGLSYQYTISRRITKEKMRIYVNYISYAAMYAFGK